MLNLSLKVLLMKKKGKLVIYRTNKIKNLLMATWYEGMGKFPYQT